MNYLHIFQMPARAGDRRDVRNLHNFRIEMTCESPLTFDELSDAMFHDIVDYIEKKINGDVGIAAYYEITEQGNPIMRKIRLGRFEETE